MMRGSTQFDWVFWLQWLLATTVGMLVGGMLAVPIGFGVGEVVQDSLGERFGLVVAGVLFGLLLGAGLGIAQWLVLRQRLQYPNLWAPATAIPAAIGLALSFSMFPQWTESEVAVGIIFSVSIAIPVSIGQWLVLRKQAPQATLWLLVSAIGLALGIVALSIIADEGREIIALTTGGLVAGAVTGVGIVGILRPGVITT